VWVNLRLNLLAHSIENADCFACVCILVSVYMYLGLFCVSESAIDNFGTQSRKRTFFFIRKRSLFVRDLVYVLESAIDNVGAQYWKHRFLFTCIWVSFRMYIGLFYVVESAVENAGTQ